MRMFFFIAFFSLCLASNLFADPSDSPDAILEDALLICDSCVKEVQEGIKWAKSHGREGSTVCKSFGTGNRSDFFCPGKDVINMEGLLAHWQLLDPACASYFATFGLQNPPNQINGHSDYLTFLKRQIYAKSPCLKAVTDSDSIIGLDGEIASHIFDMSPSNYCSAVPKSIEPQSVPKVKDDHSSIASDVEKKLQFAGFMCNHLNGVVRCRNVNQQGKVVPFAGYSRPVHIDFPENLESTQRADLFFHGTENSSFHAHNMVDFFESRLSQNDKSLLRKDTLLILPESTGLDVDFNQYFGTKGNFDQFIGKLDSVLDHSESQKISDIEISGHSGGHMPVGRLLSLAHQEKINGNNSSALSKIKKVSLFDALYGSSALKFSNWINDDPSHVFLSVCNSDGGTECNTVSDLRSKLAGLNASTVQVPTQNPNVAKLRTIKTWTSPQVYLETQAGNTYSGSKLCTERDKTGENDPNNPSYALKFMCTSAANHLGTAGDSFIRFSNADDPSNLSP